MTKRASEKAPNMPVTYWPSHTRFTDLLGHCSHPIGIDHIADTCELHLDDVDSHFWAKGAEKSGVLAQRMLCELEDRVRKEHDLRAAETLYAIATEAARAVVTLYLRHRDLFDQIAPRRKFLPSLFSIHPSTAEVMAQMFADSRLGTQTDHGLQAGSRAYFVSDSPANVYARAIIICVSFNRELFPVSCQQYGWKAFDRKHGVRTVVLPFPKYVERLDELPIPITPESAIDYWRKGKEMILEEMPDFHLRREWEAFHHRKYKTGAKTGAIQHAIFKDILTALKTIAGVGKKKSAQPALKA